MGIIFSATMIILGSFTIGMHLGYGVGMGVFFVATGICASVVE